jgi:hypothetical protein
VNLSRLEMYRATHLPERAGAFLAQWLERVAVNHKVVGSIPTGGVVVTFSSPAGCPSSRHPSSCDSAQRHLRCTGDTVSEWLRRWTRNPLGSAREGSNPFGVGFATSRQK